MLHERGDRIKRKCEALAWQGIADALPGLLEEGGTTEVLKFLAYLAHGETLASQVVAKIKGAAEKILVKSS